MDELLNSKAGSILVTAIIFMIVFLVVDEIITYILNKKKLEQTYMNGDLYVKYPPDVYPNFPGSIV